MDVEDRKKNADANGSAARKIGLVHLADVCDRAVRGAHERGSFNGCHPVRVAKEGDDEQPQNHVDAEEDPKEPMHGNRRGGENQRPGEKEHAV